MTVKIERLGHILGLAEHFATIKIILILLSVYDIYYIYSMIDYARYINIYDYILYSFILSINVFIFFVFKRVKGEYSKEKIRSYYY